MAKAAATLWVVEIAKSEGYQDILVEGDSKICMDALNGSEENWNWKIDNLCFEAKLLCVFLFLFVFVGLVEKLITLLTLWPRLLLL
jgi:hypothetical protein